jgi:hypothetical protein
MDGDLAGGVANAGRVTREGDAVLRPANPYSPTIHTFLTTLRGGGFDGASLPRAIQDDGRERLDFIEGDVAIPPFPHWAQTDAALASVVRLMLRFHRASAQVVPGPGPWSDELADPDGGPVICHNDVCLENVVFRDGAAVGLLDFDFAAPGRPEFDLAACARMCVPVDDDVSARNFGWIPADRPGRLRLVADTYGLDGNGRQQLLVHLDRSMAHGGEFVRRRVAAGDPNFVRMLEAMGGMERYARRYRWWTDERRRFVDALA